MNIGTPEKSEVPKYNLGNIWIDKINEDQFKIRMKTTGDETTILSTVVLTELDLMKISYIINKYLKNVNR